MAIHEFIKDIENNTVFHRTNNQISIRNTTIHQFQRFLKNKSIRNAIDDILIHMQNATRQFCQENQNIIFTKADKGNITIAMDKEFYIKKMEESLSNANTYVVVNRNPTKSIEKNLNNFLKT